MIELTERLKEICEPRRVSDRPADRICHTRDCGPSPGGMPAVVVRPQSSEEVMEIVRLANELKTPIFVWGRSTTFIGAGVPEGCILMALDLMSVFVIAMNSAAPTPLPETSPTQKQSRFGSNANTS